MASCDVAIIGSGPAGCSAAIYAGRDLLDVVVFEKSDFGGQIAASSEVENYPGVQRIDGYSLMSTMRDQATSFGARFVQSQVTALEVALDGEFTLRSDAGSYVAKAVIACLGRSSARAGFAGEIEFTGRGVSYCATCDAMFYRNKQVFVCGGGNSAAEEALFLSQFASSVTLLVRKGFMRAEAGLVGRLQTTTNIEIRYNTSIVTVRGSDLLNAIVLRDNVTGQESLLEFDESGFGVFVYVGANPNTGLLNGFVAFNDAGYVQTDDTMATSTPGLFVAGDCRASNLKQVVTAVSDGAIAAVSASKYLSSVKTR